MNAVYDLPKNVMTCPEWKKKFSKFLDLYQDDLPHPRFLDTEVEMWSRRWKVEKDPLPSKLTAVLPFVDRLSFPNLYTTLQIFATIPVTTCTCEIYICIKATKNVLSERHVRI